MWITGQVVDDHGQALAGVIVAVVGAIGRRAAISNSQGQYVMQDLPPGPYTITFTLSGFTTLKRQIDRVSNFAATINASLQTLVTSRSSE